MCLKKVLVALFLMLSIKCCIYSQFTMFSGGLGFSSGVNFNYIPSGNPGLFFKPYLKINNRFYFTPSLTVFNISSKEEFFYKLTNFMFHIDLDGQYGLIKEDKIVLFALAGLNGTTIISRFKKLEDVSMPNQISSASVIKPGVNLGAGIKMYVNKSYNAVLTAKYTAGEFSQFIISLGVIYHLNENNRKGW